MLPALQHDACSEPCLPDSLLCLVSGVPVSFHVVATHLWHCFRCFRTLRMFVSLTLPLSPARQRRREANLGLGVHISCAAPLLYDAAAQCRPQQFRKRLEASLGPETVAAAREYMKHLQRRAYSSC